MSKYSDDYIIEVKDHLSKASRHFYNGTYTDEIYYLQKAKEDIERAIEKAITERKDFIRFNS